MSQDLPGLVGGEYRGLSALISEMVTFTDPAFHNLEFHRRMAMDNAGYFMPGYKPTVSSSVGYSLVGISTSQACFNSLLVAPPPIYCSKQRGRFETIEFSAPVARHSLERTAFQR